MNKIWNAVLDAVNPSRKSDALFEAAMFHLKRAGNPSKVDVLYAEAMTSISAAVAAMNK
jgi:hypothetical protein